MSKEKATNWIIQAVIVVVLAAPVLGLLYLGTVRAADVYYKTVWIVRHWNDAEAFPAGSNLCMQQFCTHTDTKLKHVGGRSGYTSEKEYYYCPVHESSFVHTDGKFDGLLYFCYWIVAIACSAIPAFLLLLLIPPLGRMTHWIGKPLSWLVAAADVVAWAILIPSWIVFAWW